MVIQPQEYIRHLTWLTYSFPTNSSIFQSRRTWIPRGCAQYYHTILLWFSARKKSRQEIRADSCRKWQNPAITYVHSYVQYLYVHSQHTSFISGVKWLETWNVDLYICTRACYIALHTTYAHTTSKETTPTWYIALVYSKYCACLWQTFKITAS